MVSQKQLDFLVKQKRKCRPGKPCHDTLEQSQVTIAPPVTTDSELSAFRVPADFMPVSMSTAATRIKHYSDSMHDLTDEITKVQDQITSYQTRTDTTGFGPYIEEGQLLNQHLTEHRNVVRHKGLMHRNLKLDDLRLLYTHAVNGRINQGVAHPPNHPMNPNTVHNKAFLIEALTEDYGYDPLGILSFHNNLPPTAPPTPPTAPTTPP